MRDEQVYRMYAKVAQRMELLVQQFQFLMTRIEAVVQVHGKSDEIDKIHMELLTKHKNEMAAVAQQMKEEANKPKLILVQ